MTFRTIALILTSISLAGCLTAYPKVENIDQAAFIKFERNIQDPLLGSITRYVKVDDKQKCNQGYSEYLLLAVQNKGNPLVSDLNLDGLYVKPGNFRILANTLAGSASCDIFVNFDMQAGQKYKMVVNGNVYISTNRCSAKLYQLTAQGAYKEKKFKKYQECNK